MAKHKRKRKSRKSLGREGHPKRFRTSTGMTRLLNQLEAHLKGKDTKVFVPATVGCDGITVTREDNKGVKHTISLKDHLARKGAKFSSKLPNTKYKAVSGEELWGKQHASKRTKR